MAPMQKLMRRIGPLPDLWWRIPVALVLLLWLAPACLLGVAAACVVGALVGVVHIAIRAIQRLALFLGDL